MIEYVVPVQWVDGQMATVINNMGDVATYPIITLVGITHNPIIRNLTTNSKVQLSRTTTSASDSIVIDMKQRIITLNGVSIAADRSLDSTWWDLAPGDNLIVLESDNSGDISLGSIKYKVGYRGI